MATRTTLPPLIYCFNSISANGARILPAGLQRKTFTGNTVGADGLQHLSPGTNNNETFPSIFLRMTYGHANFKTVICFTPAFHIFPIAVLKIMNLHTWFSFIIIGLAFIMPAWAHVDGEDNRALEVKSKVALVIGNAGYTEASPLKNSGNDASDMCAALKKLGFDVICKLDIATKREFKDAIYEFTGKVNSRSVALFYFAGHGLQIDGLNYLVPVNAALRTRSDLEDESVQINYLMSELDARQAALNIFLLDACRDNPYANPTRGYVPRLGLASQLFAPRNSIIAMSTGAGQLSLDGDGRNGTFTKNLLQHLGTPRQSIEEMLKAASSGTRADASRLKRQQDPQITMSFTDKFCLAGCSDAAPRSDDSQLAARTTELNRLQATIAETRVKQAELDAQRALLLERRAELDVLRQGLASAESKKEELARRHADIARRETELARLDVDIRLSTDKFNELEAVRQSLQQKHEEVERMRQSLALQQATIAAARDEFATRSVKPPVKKAPAPTVVPAF